MNNEEYWHLNANGDGSAGPFQSLEDAKADALPFLHSGRFGVEEVLIVKVVARSNTKVSFDTTWEEP